MISSQQLIPVFQGVFGEPDLLLLHLCKTSRLKPIRGIGSSGPPLTEWRAYGKVHSLYRCLLRLLLCPQPHFRCCSLRVLCPAPLSFSAGSVWSSLSTSADFRASRALSRPVQSPQPSGLFFSFGDLAGSDTRGTQESTNCIAASNSFYSEYSISDIMKTFTKRHRLTCTNSLLSPRLK